MTPRLTLEICSSTGKVRVFGKRSNKGWRVLIADNPIPLATKLNKEQAIRLALDACGESINTDYSVKPSL